MKLAFDLNFIFNEIFNDTKVTQSLVSDYQCDIHLPKVHNGSFDNEEVKTFCREVFYDGNQFKTKELSNQLIMSAALDAIGSNMRKWSAYFPYRKKVLNICQEYYEEPENALEKLSEIVKGQSGKNDRKAMLRWTYMLNQHMDIDIILQQADINARNVAQKRNKPKMLKEQHLVMLELACSLNMSKTAPVSRKTQYKDSRKIQLMGAESGDIFSQKNAWGLPGMSIVLTTEFLRNLGYQGVKPDRHIVRLLNFLIQHNNMKELEPLIAQSYKLAAELIYDYGLDPINQISVIFTSIIMSALCPDEFPVTYLDNLIWLLGSYKYKKGNEVKVPLIIK